MRRVRLPGREERIGIDHEHARSRALLSQDRERKAAPFAITEAEDEEGYIAAAEIATDRRAGKSCLGQAVSEEDDLSVADAVAQARLQRMIYRTVLVVAVTVAAAIGEKVVAVVSARPALQVLGRHLANAAGEHPENGEACEQCCAQARFRNDIHPADPEHQNLK